MGFFRTARNSAAMQYGITRAEKYGRVARIWLYVKVGVVLVPLAWVAWAGFTSR